MTEFMTAIEITRFGEPDVLKPRQLPVPDIKDDELLIRVAAAGVNRPDIMQRTGMYLAPKGASEIPG
ncbi:MAG: NAD(P)H-quinone oxidoreductase, partial [Alphaproteobacteria bacterium]|nr:NAD(P)H-quinone oxidoreductase [Alphaproteobacteria bacterium]